MRDINILIEKIVCPECGHIIEYHKNPLPTIDVIVDVNGRIVLVKRKNPPHGWALPGGFINYGESAEDAAIREIREETGLEITGLNQFHCYSNSDRDPRFHTLTVVFTAKSTGTPVAGDDASGIGLFDMDNLPLPLAFDHENILNDYFKSLNC